jgi:hypothetical protein
MTTNEKSNWIQLKTLNQKAKYASLVMMSLISTLGFRFFIDILMRFLIHWKVKVISFLTSPYTPQNSNVFIFFFNWKLLNLESLEPYNFGTENRCKMKLIYLFLAQRDLLFGITYFIPYFPNWIEGTCSLSIWPHSLHCNVNNFIKLNIQNLILKLK